jgi:serine phosphatase RsbU (regulator of sigma subunit)
MTQIGPSIDLARPRPSSLVRIFDAESSDSKRTADILLVDDTAANLLALEAILDDLGQNIVKASSGQDALRYLLNHDVAVILLDVQMPGMDGFEAASWIRSRERSRHTPIVFLTAHEQTDAQFFRGYEAGAVDFLTKPFVPAILRSKVNVFVELFQKAEQIKWHAERLRQIELQEHERQLAVAKERLAHEKLYGELHIAQQIQQNLFPRSPPKTIGFEISGASWSAEATGGDYFDYIPMQDGGLTLAIGDVSGHGLGPALLMAALRAYLRAFLLTRTDVSEIVALLDAALEPDAPPGRFATLLLIRMDPVSRSIVYSSAGHLPAYVLNSEGAIKRVLHATGIPLAIDRSSSYDAVKIPPLDPGDLLLMITDGVVEATDGNGVQFGTERLLSVVRANLVQTAEAITAALHGAIAEYSRSSALEDDMTVIVVKAVAAD